MPFRGVPQGFEGARVTRQYRSTQFGQDRVVGAVGLAYMSHEPERMVSDGGAEAHHHGWSLRRTGTTTAEYIPNESAVKLTVGTASGDAITYRQDARNLYVPGSQQRPLFTAVFGPPRANQIAYAGYFSDSNGLGFYQSNTERGVFVRSSVTGSTVETLYPTTKWVNQSAASAWDITKNNIYEMPFAWLSAGNPEWFINHGFAHTVDFRGNIAVPWMRTPNLPLSYELKNTGATSSGGYLKAICAKCDSEGPGTLTGEVYSAENATEITSIDTTGRPVLTIQTAATVTVGTHTGLTNGGIYVPTEFGVRGTSGAGIVTCILNGGALTGSSFAATDDPGMQFDVASTAIAAGGTIVGQGAVDTTVGSMSSALEFEYPGRTLHNTAFGTQQKLTVYVAANVGLINARAYIRWKRMG